MSTHTILPRISLDAVLVLGQLAAIVMLCGCQSPGATFKSKCTGDIDFVRSAYVNGRSPVFRQFGTNILGAFSNVSAAKLKKPRFASAAMGIDQNDEYRLIVFWLEDRPSVNAVALRLAKGNSILNVAVLRGYLKQNAEVSRKSLLMAAAWVWTKTNSVCNEFNKIPDVSNIRVRLLTDGKPVSGWEPVAFYRLDRWMGSKNIKEVTSGPAVVAH